MNWLISIFGNRTFGRARSSFWNEVRDEFVKENPKCAVCGSVKIAVHHKLPFFLYPELELKKSNLISLCDWRGNNCHWIVGHCKMSWICYDERIDETSTLLNDVKKRASEQLRK